ncbi:MAG: nitrile hydratase subunit alpha [Mycobacterium sp.]
MSANDGDHFSSLSELELRVRALETVLTEKDYLTSEALDRIVEAHETRIGPHIGAKAVARAWVDPTYRAELLADATTAVATFADDGRVGDQLIAVENTSDVHNVVVCTLCSCYPWDVLGLPPVWYKSDAYRSRTVKKPREVLAEFGLALAPTVDIRVWDSTAETRYLVLPMRPPGTDGWDEDRLAALVSRDSMVGVGLPTSGSEPVGVDA